VRIKAPASGAFLLRSAHRPALAVAAYALAGAADHHHSGDAAKSRPRVDMTFIVNMKACSVPEDVDVPRPVRHRCRCPACRSVEFEPQWLSPSGYHTDVTSLQKNWSYCKDELDLQDQVDRSKQWLQLCGTSEVVCRKASSYGYKHEAERWWKVKGAGRGGYICNGALIMAALQLGMVVKRIGSSPNAYLNLSQHRFCVWEPSERCPAECQWHGHDNCGRNPQRTRSLQGDGVRKGQESP